MKERVTNAKKKAKTNREKKKSNNINIITDYSSLSEEY